MVDNPSLKDTKEGASAATAGREFNKGSPGEEANLKQSVEVEIGLGADLVLPVE